MRPDIRYSRLPDENSANSADRALINDIVTRHVTVPGPLTWAFVIITGCAGRLLIGAMTFDAFIDQIGKIADDLKEFNNTAGIGDQLN